MMENHVENYDISVCFMCSFIVPDCPHSSQIFFLTLRKFCVVCTASMPAAHVVEEYIFMYVQYFTSLSCFWFPLWHFLVVQPTTKVAVRRPPSCFFSTCVECICVCVPLIVCKRVRVCSCSRPGAWANRRSNTSHIPHFVLECFKTMCKCNIYFYLKKSNLLANWKSVFIR